MPTLHVAFTDAFIVSDEELRLRPSSISSLIATTSVEFVALLLLLPEEVLLGILMTSRTSCSTKSSNAMLTTSGLPCAVICGSQEGRSYQRKRKRYEKKTRKKKKSHGRTNEQ